MNENKLLVERGVHRLAKAVHGKHSPGSLCASFYSPNHTHTHTLGALQLHPCHRNAPDLPIVWISDDRVSNRNHGGGGRGGGEKGRKKDKWREDMETVEFTRIPHEGEHRLTAACPAGSSETRPRCAGRCLASGGICRSLLCRSRTCSASPHNARPE